MTHLTPEQVQRFRRDGFLFPLTAFPMEQAVAYRRKLEAFEARTGHPIRKPYAYKPHLLLGWIEEMARSPAVLNPIMDLLGPNILLFHVTAWPKAARDASFVSWHQDSTTFGLEPNDQHVTAWIALSESNPESGCVQALPGSHRHGQLRHISAKEDSNMLGWGQTVEHDFDPKSAADLVLRPGQFSLHHTHVLHNSPPNRSDDRRLGIALSFIPTHVRCLSDARLTAMLIAGEDSYGHYDPEPSAQAQSEEAALAFHTDSVARFYEANNQQARRHAGAS